MKVFFRVALCWVVCIYMVPIQAGTSLAYYPAHAEYGALLFEDNFPEKGDYDFNDLIVAYNVTTKTNSDTLGVTGVSWHHILKAVGASYDNSFSVELPFVLSFTGAAVTPAFTLADTSDTASICIADGDVEVEIGACTSGICPIDNACDGSTSATSCIMACSGESCIVSGSCSELPSSVSGLAILKFFHSEKTFSGRSGFFNVNSANTGWNWGTKAPVHWKTSLKFLSSLGVADIGESSYCSLKGKVDCEYASLPPYNPFLTVKGIRGREVHLANYSGSRLYKDQIYDVSHDHAGSACGSSASHNDQCFKTATGLPWALDISDSSYNVWPRERRPVTEVFIGDGSYHSFASWVESSGSDCSSDLACTWWNSAVTAKSLDGSSLGDDFSLRVKAGSLGASKSSDEFFVTSDVTAYDGHQLDNTSQGLASTMQADWNDVLDLNATQLGELCEIIDSSHWVTKGDDPTYSSTRPYYIKNNETNSSALVHAYIVKYDDGSLLKGSASLGWSTLRSSLGDCLSSGGTCEFAGVSCYLLLESWGGSRKSLGKWAD